MKQRVLSDRLQGIRLTRPNSDGWTFPDFTDPIAGKLQEELLQKFGGIAELRSL
jgi:hypothetical protein